MASLALVSNSSRHVKVAGTMDQAQELWVLFVVPISAER